MDAQTSAAERNLKATLTPEHLKAYMLNRCRNGKHVLGAGRTDRVYDARDLATDIVGLLGVAVTSIEAKIHNCLICGAQKRYVLVTYYDGGVFEDIRFEVEC